MTEKRNRPECRCGGMLITYSHEYDAYYCPSCGDWVSDKCPDVDCPYCEGRPDKPLKEWYCKESEEND